MPRAGGLWEGVPLRFKAVKVTQAAANAYTQGSISFNIDENDNIGALLWSIEFSIGDGWGNIVGDNDYWEAQVTYYSQSAILSIDDPDLLWYHKSWFASGAAGVSHFQDPIFVRLPHPILIAHPEIYVAIDSDSLPAALTLSCRLGYTMREVPVDQFAMSLRRR